MVPSLQREKNPPPPGHLLCWRPWSPLPEELLTVRRGDPDCGSVQGGAGGASVRGRRGRPQNCTDSDKHLPSAPCARHCARAGLSTDQSQQVPLARQPSLRAADGNPWGEPQAGIHGPRACHGLTSREVTESGLSCGHLPRRV